MLLTSFFKISVNLTSHFATRWPRLAFRFWLGLILVIRSISLISYLYILWVISLFIRSEVMHTFTISSHFLMHMFTVWMFAETLWFPYQLWALRRFQSIHPHYHAYNDKSSRRFLFDKCFDAILKSAPMNFDHESVLDYLRNVFKGWFFDASLEKIRKGNVAIWLAWAFFDCDLYQLNSSEEKEIQEFITNLEAFLEFKFGDGRNPNVTCIRLTLDPVQAKSRPLIYYVVISFFRYLSHITLGQMGFITRTIIPIGLDKHGISMPQRFFYRPALYESSPNAKPIVFLHGIGIGFAHYLPLIESFPKSVPIYMLEWPHISMRIVSSVPTPFSTTNAIETILDQDSHKDACFVAHSLGTAAVAWMLKSHLFQTSSSNLGNSSYSNSDSDPNVNLHFSGNHKSNRVASVVLLDPINFLLFDPTTAYSFVYRNPSTVLELVLNYFVSRELHIAWSIGRHFLWSWNVLFVEDLPKKGLINCVMLSGDDGIVPAKTCERYLFRKKQELYFAHTDMTYYNSDSIITPEMTASLQSMNIQSSKWMEKNSDVNANKTEYLDIVFLENMTHGELMLHKEAINLVQERIYIACGLNLLNMQDKKES